MAVELKCLEEDQTVQQVFYQRRFTNSRHYWPTVLLTVDL